MEIDSTNFWPCLLPILKDISNATFIAIDVEMSGISTRQRNRSNHRTQGVSKPTLQQQYEETVEAAELYQILQVGITCVEEDREKNIYVAKPYNFNINPLFEDEKLDISRDITLSSSAIQFLIKHGFDMGALFTRGVKYLSHGEIDMAREKARERMNRSATIPDLIIPPGDVEALSFFRKSRQTIQDWVTQKDDMDFINVGIAGGHLNGFQRRLIYQLIRNEFPLYRCFPRNNGDFMQIVKTDVAKEAKIEKQRLATFDQILAKQTAFGYVFNAITTGDISGLDPKWVCHSASGEPIFNDTTDKLREIHKLQKALEAKTQIIVGHNLFTDLIFLYKTFVGKLPKDVVDYNAEVHRLFPVVLDTKFIATQNQGGRTMRGASGLGELHEAMKGQSRPLICLSENHGSYAEGGRDHEAGYDSWMTAQVFVKLASKLQADQLHNLDDSLTHDAHSKVNSPNNGIKWTQTITEPVAHFVPEDPQRTAKVSVKVEAPKAPSNTTFKDPVKPTKTPEFEYETTPEPTTDDGPILFIDHGPDGRLIPSPRKLKQPNVSAIKENTPMKSRFSSTNAFDMLGAMDNDFDDSSNIELGIGGISAATEERLKTDGGLDLMDKSKRDGTLVTHEPRQWIPAKDNAFWGLYSNLLRVYGTEHEMCNLVGKADQEKLGI